MLVPALMLADVVMVCGVWGETEGGPWGGAGNCGVLSEAERCNGS